MATPSVAAWSNPALTKAQAIIAAVDSTHDIATALWRSELDVKHILSVHSPIVPTNEDLQTAVQTLVSQADP